MTRRDKVNYYLDIAESVSERGTCLRRRYGCIIVKDDEIVSTGYAGAPRGRKNCCDLGYCRREALNVPRGERYELCRSVHAEQMLGSTRYLVGVEGKDGSYTPNAECCSLCKRMVINAGITTVIARIDKNNFRVFDVASEWVDKDDSMEGIEG